MPRPVAHMNSLSRGKVRASMNKYNLFNLYKKPSIRHTGRTLYQQKWTSKAETRAYHGEHLRERRFKTIFSPKLESVAQLDASIKGEEVENTPLALQAYASLEKRLEFAVFRAMFASSIRQARQFILGGYVKVNGVVIKHPAYPLTSGDMFSVDPERVLVAMGRVKPSLDQSIKVDHKQILVWNKYVKNAKENPKLIWDLKQLKPKSLNTIDKETTNVSVKQINEHIDKRMLQDQNATTREAVLLKILQLGDNQEIGEDKALVFDSVCGPQNSIKCFNVYNRFFEAKHELLTNKNITNIGEFLHKKSTEFKSNVDAKFAAKTKQILNELVKTQLEQIRITAQESKLPEDLSKVPYTPDFSTKLIFHKPLNKEEIKQDESKAKISLPWQKNLFGRKESSKPYFTPWTPRPFIGAFAILPSHIEVSFKTCHAVYLRDPVARPGHSEVISPFPLHVHERAYMYYSRKGM